MTQSTYLEDFLESIQNLPHELKTNFLRLRELDAKVQAVLKKTERDTQSYISTARKSPSDVWELYEQLRKQNDSDDKECISISDEKVNLAYQTYELVDQHIRRLDVDLKKFEEELKQDRSKVEQPFPSEMRRDKNIKTISPAKGKARDKMMDGVTKPAGGSKKNRPNDMLGTLAGGLPPDLEDNAPTVMKMEEDLPIDPNEPIYCMCRQVSFGEMVACDNPDCPIEWFHFQCVGLTATPKGKWYCPQCNTAMRRGRMKFLG
mmetsp:Transcript_32651/g.55059  ORF Transcript_32651/g.55059 Transcript_32651/m.55059 type:complete len:261 (+) Transcript_32651:60-842(+)